jgi:hypothetical protein
VGSASAYHLSVTTAKPRPLADYLKPQYRFAEISEQQIADLGAAVESDYKKLTDKIQPE